ncbi:CbtA family protein [Celeribacter litoreus]|uniref:CbtA family protein n=1 Tax=Celeribacter litoreus TaxID=2876714 RepID=UPI001CCC5EB7|nr:CbtA family protein [Celeribacter litoreus]MCA0042329.1 CbtA family protein [Celeribacter litoreus]
MAKKVFVSALFAGLAAGVLAALLQFVFVVPSMMEGELYEVGTRVHFGANGAQSPAGVPSIMHEMGRHTTTFTSNLVVYTGFGLLMVVGFAFAESFGRKIDARTGLIWGLCGFAAVHLATAFGLPPKLPGMVAADIVARQVWWIGTIIATLIGLGLIGYGRGIAVILMGFVIILIPHILGAPTLDTYFGVAPPELAGLYVARSLGVAAISWAVLGAIAGAIWAKEA